VVLASGAGTRVGAARNKVLLPLAGRAVLSWSVEALARTPGVGVLVLVTRPEDDDLIDALVDGELAGTPIERVHGGVTRHDSELGALRHLAARIEGGGIDTVLIHDAARPLVSPELAAAVLAAAREYGAAIPGVREELLRVDEAGHCVDGACDDLIRVQTPQGCRAAPLLAAYERAATDGYDGTDTASCVERYAGLPVHWVPGDPANFKITYPHDLVAAGRVLWEHHAS
jgi:2-C-methyl-D-erythritol 4-phosphate cytidylyltransferase